MQWLFVAGTMTQCPDIGRVHLLEAGPLAAVQLYSQPKKTKSLCVLNTCCESKREREKDLRLTQKIPY